MNNLMKCVIVFVISYS